MIEHKNVTLYNFGFRIHGSLVSWEDFDKILEILPELANEKLGWFSFMGPPSSCEMARGEAKEIVEALFSKEVPTERHPLEGS